MRFDETYNEHINQIEEGKLSSLAAAGLIAAAGAPQMAQGAVSKGNPTQMVQSTQTTPNSTILASVIDFTAQHEGFREKAYLDTKGIPTIGYGTNLKEAGNIQKLKSMGYDPKRLLNKTQTIKEEDAKKMLKLGLETAIEHARSYLSNFDNQPLKVKMILTDMAYNLGPNRLANFKDFKSALLKKNYVQAKAEMMDSDWFKQVGNRSKKLVSMMGEVSNRG